MDLLHPNNLYKDRGIAGQDMPEAKVLLPLPEPQPKTMHACQDARMHAWMDVHRTASFVDGTTIAC